MSQRNVDIVVGTFEAVNVRDFEAVMDAYADDVVLALHGELRGLGADGAVGKEAVGEWFGDWFRTFDRGYRFEVNEARDWGERVLIVATHHGRGRVSGAPMAQRNGWIYTLRDDKIVRCDVYAEPELALDAERRRGTGNVETVRRILDDWARGDFAGPTRLLDPEVVFETFMPDSNENVVARGADELEAFTRDWLAQWSDYRIVAEELEEVDDQTIFASVRQLAACRHSGAEVDSLGFSVWTLRDRKVVRLSLHYSRDDALAAAGLSG